MCTCEIRNMVKRSQKTESGEYLELDMAITNEIHIWNFCFNREDPVIPHFGHAQV